MVSLQIFLQGNILGEKTNCTIIERRCSFLTEIILSIILVTCTFDVTTDRYGQRMNYCGTCIVIVNWEVDRNSFNTFEKNRWTEAPNCHGFVLGIISWTGYDAWGLIWQSHTDRRTLLYTLDKTYGICGGLLPSFDLSVASRTTPVLDAICQNVKNTDPLRPN
jgi:hypothetical protein